ncbi:MAG: shikimate kinase [Sulfurisoma sp.]|nr:shikimate kinase [Sulfurisoma sp.]
MTACRNLCLVGMMGAGKTTVGRQLAKKLGRRFVDADHEIEAQTGVSIPTIFEIEGEAGFRRREAETIEALTRESGLVLATGGGAVLDPANRRRLGESGLVVYLRVLPLALYERTRHDRNRPLLQVADPLAKLEELFAQRDPLYREVADVVVDTAASGGVGSLVRFIEQEIRKQCEP